MCQVAATLYSQFENHGAGIDNILLLVCFSELFMSESWPLFFEREREQLEIKKERGEKW